MDKCRVNKRENPYVNIDKTVINDSNLSFRATGLLVYLLSLPTDWKLRLNHLMTVKKDGMAACKAALKELREHNYCHYYEVREKGKVVETFYDFYEIPTEFDESNADKILAELGFDKDKYTICFKPIKTTNNSDVLPKVEKPLTAKPLAENHRLQNNNNTNKELYKYHDHDARENELDIFEKLFTEKFKINFTRTNQEAIKKLLKKQTEKEVVDYLEELFANIANTPGVKDIAALFSSKLKKGERQLSASQIKEIAKKEKPTTQVAPGTDEFEEIKNKVCERTNYWLDYFIISKDRDKAINSFYADVDRYITEYPSLVEEYYNKLIKAMDKI